MCYFYLLEYIVRLKGRFVIFTGDDHGFPETATNNERIRQHRSDLCKRLLVTRFGDWLIQLRASHVHPSIFHKLPDGYILTVGGHVIGKNLEESIIGGVTYGPCGEVHANVYLCFVHGYRAVERACGEYITACKSA